MVMDQNKKNKIQLVILKTKKYKIQQVKTFLKAKNKQKLNKVKKINNRKT